MRYASKGLPQGGGEWETPQWFFDVLNTEFGFTLDPCATADNAKCACFFTKADNGLAQPWSGTVFVNPPYGHGIAQWVAKSYREARRGATVVMLLPAGTDTRWWHDYVMRASEIRFLEGRLYFGNGGGRAPFASVVVVFRPEGDGKSVIGCMVARRRERCD